jgi:hypothetical protein
MGPFERSPPNSAGIFILLATPQYFDGGRCFWRCLVCICSKTFERQAKTAPPVELRWNKQAHSIVANEMHTLRLVMFAGVKGGLIVKADKNLKSNPSNCASVLTFKRGIVESLSQFFWADKNRVVTDEYLIRENQLSVVKMAIHGLLQLCGNPSSNLYGIVYASDDWFHPRQNVLRNGVAHVSYFVAKVNFNATIGSKGEAGTNHYVIYSDPRSIRQVKLPLRQIRLSDGLHGQRLGVFSGLLGICRRP